MSWSVCPCISADPGWSPKHNIYALLFKFKLHLQCERTKINKKRPGLVYILKNSKKKFGIPPSYYWFSLFPERFKRKFRPKYQKSATLRKQFLWSCHIWPKEKISTFKSVEEAFFLRVKLLSSIRLFFEFFAL